MCRGRRIVCRPDFTYNQSSRPNRCTANWDRSVATELAPTTAHDLSSVVILIPAYNEERNVGSVVLRLRQLVGTVIVINDGSHDATVRWRCWPAPPS